MQPGVLADVVGHDVEQILLQVQGLLRGTVERGEQNGLAAATLTEHCNVPGTPQRSADRPAHRRIS
jgi:hypothetical protein